MKYYTREWYEMMQIGGLQGMYKKIPDGSYSDQQIQELYNQKLKKEIARDRKEYNQPPVFFDIDFDEASLDDFLMVDENSGTARIPESIEEVKADYDREYKQAMEKFNNRPAFDPQETIDLFQEIYKSNLKTIYHNLPQYVLEGVDHRLLALDYMTETIYNLYNQEIKDARKKWNAINKKAERALSKQDIPETIHEALALHDGSLLLLKKEKHDLIMIIRKDGISLEGETPYRKVIFKEGEILEKDPIHTRKYLDDDGFYTSSVYYLYDEIYHEDLYEVHMMLLKGDNLPYLTIQCSDIEYVDNIEIE